MNDKIRNLPYEGIFKELESFPYGVFKENFDDLWELMEFYNGVKPHLDEEIRKRLGLRSTAHLEELVENLFPIGSRVSFLAHGNIRSGTITKICKDGDKDVFVPDFRINCSCKSGDIFFEKDNGHLSQVNMFALLQEFYWREIFPMRAKKCVSDPSY